MDWSQVTWYPIGDNSGTDHTGDESDEDVDRSFWYKDRSETDHIEEDVNKDLSNMDHIGKDVNEVLMASKVIKKERLPEDIAKEKELQKWKDFEVYEEVVNTG